MSKVILLISGAVVAINLIYVLLPDGSFEKFSRHILGLVLILVFANTVLKFDISSEVLNFNNHVPVYNTEKVREVLNGQTKKIVEEKIAEELESNDINTDSIHAEISDNVLTKVRVFGSIAEADKIKNIVSKFCDIDKECVVVE